MAHGGTIYLDEIGEISQATQVNLLRVLDTSAFRHLGGTSEIRVDVRVLAATNRDLRVMVSKGLFREDLFYRMSTITVEIPPLRKRGRDIELLAQYFVAMLNERYGTAKALAGSALEALCGHGWPGNVRGVPPAPSECHATVPGRLSPGSSWTCFKHTNMCCTSQSDRCAVKKSRR